MLKHALVPLACLGMGLASLVPGVLPATSDVAPTCRIEEEPAAGIHTLACASGGGPAQTWALLTGGGRCYATVDVRAGEWQLACGDTTIVIDASFHSGELSCALAGAPLPSSCALVRLGG